MKYFFLYTELADYTMQCFKVHLNRHPDDEIHVVHYPVNSEAPFVFDIHPGLHLYNKASLKDTALHELADSLNADVLVCSGWADRNYNEIADGLSIKGVPVVLCFDNIFRATLKQLLFLPFARVIFKKRYAAAWVPGYKQRRFANLLGFNNERVFTGFYATDSARFEEIFSRHKAAKSEKMPHVFLCVARYIPQKGLIYMWQAFDEIKQKTKTDWELWCAGTGEGFGYRIEAEGIKHLGFVQPGDFENLIQNAGVFILPSLFEPWGVAVNEFAASGMPLLLSNKVGSGEAYLEDGKNGYLFRPGNVKSIKEKMLKIMQASQSELNAMAEHSHALGIRTSAEKWSETLTGIGQNLKLKK